jgi:hypothetical protein
VNLPKNDQYCRSPGSYRKVSGSYREAHSGFCFAHARFQWPPEATGSYPEGKRKALRVCSKSLKNCCYDFLGYRKRPEAIRKESGRQCQEFLVFLGIPWYSLVFLGIPCIPRYSLVFLSIPWYSVVFLGIPWYSLYSLVFLVFLGIPAYS